MVVRSAQHAYRERAPRTPDGERHCDVSARACASAGQVDRCQEADVPRLHANAASQSMTPRILSWRGARASRLQRLMLLLQMPHEPRVPLLIKP